MPIVCGEDYLIAGQISVQKNSHLPERSGGKSPGKYFQGARKVRKFWKGRGPKDREFKNNEIIYSMKHFGIKSTVSQNTEHDKQASFIIFQTIIERTLFKKQQTIYG